MSHPVAADSIAFRIEPRDDRGPNGFGVQDGIVLVTGGLLALAAAAAPTYDLLVYRVVTGEVIARGPIFPESKIRLQLAMTQDLGRLTEDVFLGRWGDPELWLATTP